MATITLPTVVTPAVVAAVENNMRRCFAELERAEQRGAPSDVREKLYQAYLTAYAAYCEAVRRVQQGG
jgi:hypothetical protein